MEPERRRDTGQLDWEINRQREESFGQSEVVEYSQAVGLGRVQTGKGKPGSCRCGRSIDRGV